MLLTQVIGNFLFILPLFKGPKINVNLCTCCLHSKVYGSSFSFKKICFKVYLLQTGFSTILRKDFWKKVFLLLDKYNLSSKVKHPKSQILMIISVSSNQKRSSPCLDQSETELVTFSYSWGSAILGTCLILMFSLSLHLYFFYVGV